MKIQIVCRGSIKDGLGHLFRTRTFANEALKGHSVSIVAIIEKQLETIFTDTKCDKHYVRRDDEIVKYVNNFKPDILLFDLTSIDLEPFTATKQVFPLVSSLSPIFNHSDKLDILFTRTTKFKNLPKTKIYGGLKYTIFRENIPTIDDKTFQKNLTRRELYVVICMGGSDAANKTLAVLKSVIKLDLSCIFWVLLGEGYLHSYDELIKVTRLNTIHEIILAKTSRSMWHIMSNCSLGIFAGGLTTLEAVYAGLPTINIFERKEQMNAVSEKLFEIGACLSSGSFSNNSLQDLIELLKVLHKDRKQLLEIRRRCNGLIDLHGSKRVLKKLEEHFASVNIL